MCDVTWFWSRDNCRPGVQKIVVAGNNNPSSISHIFYDHEKFTFVARKSKRSCTRALFITFQNCLGFYDFFWNFLYASFALFFFLSWWRAHIYCCKFENIVSCKFSAVCVFQCRPRSLRCETSNYGLQRIFANRKQLFSLLHSVPALWKVGTLARSVARRVWP